jgi:hypothetical protein
MTYAETGKLASAVAVNDLIRAYVSADGHGKQFGDGTTSASCPSVASITQISQETQNVLPGTDANTSTVNGALRFFLTPASGDTTTAGSQQAPWLEPTATVVVATG